MPNSFVLKKKSSPALLFSKIDQIKIFQAHEYIFQTRGIQPCLLHFFFFFKNGPPSSFFFPKGKKKKKIKILRFPKKKTKKQKQNRAFIFKLGTFGSASLN